MKNSDFKVIIRKYEIHRDKSDKRYRKLYAKAKYHCGYKQTALNIDNEVKQHL